jgi:hypothetical protein
VELPHQADESPISEPVEDAGLGLIELGHTRLAWDPGTMIEQQMPIRPVLMDEVGNPADDLPLKPGQHLNCDDNPDV